MIEWLSDNAWWGAIVLVVAQIAAIVWAMRGGRFEEPATLRTPTSGPSRWATGRDPERARPRAPHAIQSDRRAGPDATPTDADGRASG